MVTQMIETGEESGALDDMLDKVATFYDNEVSATVDSLTSILEPLIIIFMGACIGCIVVSLYYRCSTTSSSYSNHRVSVYGPEWSSRSEGCFIGRLCPASSSKRPKKADMKVRMNVAPSPDSLRLSNGSFEYLSACSQRLTCLGKSAAPVVSFSVSGAL